MERVITKSFKRLLDKGVHRGFITYEELGKSLGKRHFNQDNVEKASLHIFDNKVCLVEKKSDYRLNKKKETASSSEKDKDVDKSDDPIRMYLREMGGVELLSREGEIAIAKRIEAGREKMIGAICESPMTIRSIINWKESIKEGTMLLRDIVDLEQTYDLSDVGEAKIDDTLKLIEGFKSDNISDEEKKPKKKVMKSQKILKMILKTKMLMMKNQV